LSIQFDFFLVSFLAAIPPNFKLFFYFSGRIGACQVLTEELHYTLLKVFMETRFVDYVFRLSEPLPPPHLSTPLSSDPVSRCGRKGTPMWSLYVETGAITPLRRVNRVAEHADGWMVSRVFHWLRRPNYETWSRSTLLNGVRAN